MIGGASWKLVALCFFCISTFISKNHPDIDGFCFFLGGTVDGEEKSIVVMCTERIDKIRRT